MFGRLRSFVVTAAGVYLAIGLALAVANASTLAYFIVAAQFGDGGQTLSIREYGLYTLGLSLLLFALVVRRVVGLCRIPLKPSPRQAAERAPGNGA